MGSPPSSSSDCLPSWPLMDFSNPLFYLFQEEPFSKMTPSPPVTNPPQPLSSQAAMGTSTTKVSKRKSRAVSKPPIRVLSADRANFRDMVQRLTGIPASTQASRLLMGGGSSSSSMAPAVFRPRPMPAGHPFSYDTSQQLMTTNQSMPTLDTSSGYLSMGLRQNNLMRSPANHGANYNIITVDSKPLLVEGGGGGGEWSYTRSNQPTNDFEAVQTSESCLTASDLESLLMGAHKLDDSLPSSWLSSDIIHLPAPAVEIAHSA